MKKHEKQQKKEYDEMWLDANSTELIHIVVSDLRDDIRHIRFEKYAEQFGGLKDIVPVCRLNCSVENLMLISDTLMTLKNEYKPVLNGYEPVLQSHIESLGWAIVERTNPDGFKNRRPGDKPEDFFPENIEDFYQKPELADLRECYVKMSGFEYTPKSRPSPAKFSRPKTALGVDNIVPASAPVSTTPAQLFQPETTPRVDNIVPASAQVSTTPVRTFQRSPTLPEELQWLPRVEDKAPAPATPAKFFQPETTSGVDDKVPASAQVSTQQASSPLPTISPEDPDEMVRDSGLGWDFCN